ncbi:MAG TPA: hypothetical protein V6D20_10310, partial [Candidatus Obscuribacterales bacterium]
MSDQVFDSIGFQGLGGSQRTSDGGLQGELSGLQVVFFEFLFVEIKVPGNNPVVAQYQASGRRSSNGWGFMSKERLVGEVNPEGPV